MSDEITLKAILQLSQQTHDLVGKVSDKQDATDKKLENHIRDESVDVRKFMELHEGAFPHGPVVHGTEHTEWKLTKDERSAIWLSVKKKVAESAAWSLIVAVGVATWFWVKEHIK